MKLLLSAATALAGLASTATSQSVMYCTTSDPNVCYSVNVPAMTAATPKGSQGDIFFQISAPSSYQWVALGQGTGMTGAHIFVIYSSSDGKNVTLSPRLGVGHVMPMMEQNAGVTLLAGSGITGGKMVANVQCSNCSSWKGGNMDLTSSSTSWIWAVKDGSPLKTDSQSATIQQHDNMDTFKLDLTKASGGADSNPYLSGGSSSGSSPAPSGSTMPSGGVYSSPASSSSSSSSSDGDGDMSDGDAAGGIALINKLNRMSIAHGVLMGLAFGIILPVGAILLRLLQHSGNRHAAIIHACVQLTAYLFFFAGMGLGIYLAVTPDYKVNQYHPVIGLLVIGLLLLQPAFGSIHHRQYLCTAKPSVWGMIHTWYGRVVITLGVINGGLGLRFAGNTTRGIVAYAVVAGIIWFAWLLVLALGKSNKSVREAVQRHKEKQRGANGHANGEANGNGVSNGNDVSNGITNANTA